MSNKWLNVKLTERNSREIIVSNGWAAGGNFMSIKLAFAGVLVASMVFCAGSSRADTIYDWTGSCTIGCTGTATGVLTLTGGAPNSFALSQFESFTYTSSSGTFSLDNSSPFLIAEGIVSPTFTSEIFLEENGAAPDPTPLPLFQFVTDTNVIPFWQFLIADSYLVDYAERDVGVDSSFVRRQNVSVPGPIVGTGLPGLLASFGAMLAWYRKRRAIAA